MIIRDISIAQCIVNKCNSRKDFTHNLTDSDSNYVVSTKSIYKGTNPSLSTDLLTQIARYSNGEYYDSIGMWEEDGVYHVDANIHLDDLSHALRIGKAFGQRAIYSKKDDQVIYITKPNHLKVKDDE